MVVHEHDDAAGRKARVGMAEAMGHQAHMREQIAAGSEVQMGEGDGRRKLLRHCCEHITGVYMRCGVVYRAFSRRTSTLMKF